MKRRHQAGVAVAGARREELRDGLLVVRRKALEVLEDALVVAGEDPRGRVEHERPEATDGPMVAGLQDDGAHRIGVAKDGRVDAHAVLTAHAIDELHHRQAVTERAAARVDVERDGLVGSPFRGRAMSRRLRKKSSACGGSMSEMK